MSFVKVVSIESRPGVVFLLEIHGEPQHCFELVHANMCGPMKTKSFGGSIYFLQLTDDYGNMSWVYFLKMKS